MLLLFWPHRSEWSLIILQFVSWIECIFLVDTLLYPYHKISFKFREIIFRIRIWKKTQENKLSNFTMGALSWKSLSEKKINFIFFPGWKRFNHHLVSPLVYRYIPELLVGPKSVCRVKHVKIRNTRNPPTSILWMSC